jgi:DNA-directed RNA polymerase subunit M/transcription elongation factor TFIIS
MDSITFRCENPDCKKTLRVNEDLAGKRVKCPKCGHKMKVPAAAASAQTPAPAQVATTKPAEKALPRPAEKAPPRPAEKVSPRPAVASVPQASAPRQEPSAAAVLLKAKRQPYGVFCPKCGGLLLPPQMELKGIVCHYCSAQIEFT